MKVCVGNVTITSEPTREQLNVQHENVVAETLQRQIPNTVVVQKELSHASIAADQNSSAHKNFSLSLIFPSKNRSYDSLALMQPCFFKMSLTAAREAGDASGTFSRVR